MDSKTIVFTKIGSFAYLNEILIRILRDKFPDYEIEIIDIRQEFVNKYDLMMYFHIFRLYGIRFTNIRSHIGENLFRTAYVFNKIKKLISKKLVEKNVLFTFQTQSLFDSSVKGIPHFVFTDHTSKANLKYPAYDPAKLPAAEWRECEKFIYHNAAMNFTMSSHVAESMAEDYQCPQKQIRVVYAGPLENNKSPVNEKKYASQNILFIGMQWERKGGPSIEEAFKIVLKSLPTASLTVVGCTPKLSTPNTQVFDRLPLEQLNEYYEQAAVFCMPALIQPFGLIYLSAMSHALPVIAANSGALPEIVKHGETGYIVEVNDVNSIAEHLINILGNPRKAKLMGSQGLSYQKQRYTWDNTANLIKSYIDTCLDRPSKEFYSPSSPSIDGEKPYFSQA